VSPYFARRCLRDETNEAQSLAEEKAAWRHTKPDWLSGQNIHICLYVANIVI